MRLVLVNTQCDSESWKTIDEFAREYMLSSFLFLISKMPYTMNWLQGGTQGILPTTSLVCLIILIPAEGYR